MNTKPTYLTRDGLEKLRLELDEMTNVRRAEVATRIHDAKEHGDLSENAEYEDAKNEQAFVEGRIQTLEALIKNATIIDEKHSTEHVQIGSTVSVESGDGKETFTIVGSTEASPRDGRISNESPVGRALLGRKKGDKVVVRVPAGDFSLHDRHDPLDPGRNGVAELRPRTVGARLPAPREGANSTGGTRTQWTGPTNSPHRSAGRRSSTTARHRRGRSTSGSLRGPVILDVITRALRARGLETILLYGVDDLDPMDAQALLTPDAVEHEMGRPLAHVPDQAGDCHASYARHHAQVFIDTFAGLGIHPDRYYWMSELYADRRVDPYIRLALDRADQVRDIYRRVANVQHPADWHPLQVVCETCGKVGTTIVTKWDGERVFYECRPNLVTWATAAARPAGSRRSAAAPSSAGTSNGPPSGASSGSRSSPCGKDLSPRPAARASERTRSPGRSSSASRRSTSPTSS